MHEVALEAHCTARYLRVVSPLLHSVFSSLFFSFFHFFSPELKNDYDGLRTLNLGPSGKWTTANLSVSRMRLEATAAMGKAYFISGMGDICGSNCSTVDVYDDAQNTWTVQHLSAPRYEFTASAAHDGHGFVVVAGKQATRSPWNLTEVFTQAAGG